MVYKDRTVTTMQVYKAGCPSERRGSRWGSRRVSRRGSRKGPRWPTCIDMIDDTLTYYIQLGFFMEWTYQERRQSGFERCERTQFSFITMLNYCMATSVDIEQTAQKHGHCVSVFDAPHPHPPHPHTMWRLVTPIVHFI